MDDAGLAVRSRENVTYYVTNSCRSRAVGLMLWVLGIEGMPEKAPEPPSPM
jgi:hypothetical protein